MKKTTVLLLLLVISCLGLQAEPLNVVPTMTPAGGSFEDNVHVTCTMPEGCTALRYWYNGGELRSNLYEGDIFVEHTADLSIAGVNEEGRIITDVVTKHFTITKVTPPWTTVTPKEGVRKESFYVTKIQWNNVTRVDLDLEEYKENGFKYGEPVVWLTNAAGRIVTYCDFNGLWVNGLNAYKAYIYKNYKVETPGEYVLHIAGGIFILDGERYEDELQYHYIVSEGNVAPEIKPESGEYVAPLTVTIDYPTDGSAFYRFYKINDAKAVAYNGPFVLTESATIEAYGMDEEFAEKTPTVQAEYVLHEPAPVPVPLPTPIIVRDGNQVSIRAERGTIKYWINDKMSTAMIYTEPLTVTENGRISCVAYDATSCSMVVNLDITDFVVDRGDKGDLEIFTPQGVSELVLNGMSPNGRYAVGYAGMGESARGFIWNLESGEMNYQGGIYVNQLVGVSNTGVAYGWRVRTAGLDDPENVEFLWGTCVNNVWTEQPADMSVVGIAGDGRLYGAQDGKPALYDMTTEQYTYLAGEGKVTTVNGDGSVQGGQSLEGGKYVTTIWVNGERRTYALETAVTQLSANGEWALIGETYRLHVPSGETEKLISMSYLYHNITNPEHLVTIANDGTLFGTYDGTTALVYTPDGRWRSAANWLLDTYGYVVKNYHLRNVHSVTGDAHTLLMSVFPNGQEADDAYTRGLALRVDVQVKNLPPSALTAEQMVGSKVIKLQWEAPIVGSRDIRGFRLYRDGALLATIASTDRTYYDRDVESGRSYAYYISALYDAEVESAPSDEVTVACMLYNHLPVRDLALRRMGLNDAVLTWTAPLTTLPTLQYYDQTGAWEAFGSMYDSEWAVRIEASDLAVFTGQQIRTVQFLPAGRQAGYEIRLYRGNGNRAETEPFYTQTIDPESLLYGTWNTILLDKAQDIVPGKDLYVAMYIVSSEDFNMFGIQYDGFRSGYTDLCHIQNAWEGFVTMSEMDSDTRIVLPLGVGICTEEQLGGALVNHYEIAEQSETLGSIRDHKFVLSQIAEGEHTYSVVAVYEDGNSSAAETISISLQNNEEAYVAVDSLTIMVDEQHRATITWEAPRDDDRTYLHYGDINPKRGLEIPESVSFYSAVSVYPATMTKDYDGDYEIMGVYFYPMEEAEFAVALTDETGEDVYLYQMLESCQLNALNYVWLEQPITVSQTEAYRLEVDVFYPAEGSAPLAYDSSNKWVDGYSNILYVGTTMLTLSEIVQIDEHPNWLMGIVIRRRDARLMPLEGYHVRLNGAQVTTDLLTEPTFTTEELEPGRYTAAVDVVYSADTCVTGADNSFLVDGLDAVNTIDADVTEGVCYDVLGRVRDPKSEHGFFIINRTKILK